MYTNMYFLSRFLVKFVVNTWISGLAPELELALRPQVKGTVVATAAVLTAAIFGASVTFFAVVDAMEREGDGMLTRCEV
jgi:hypothetical protein